MPGIVGPLVTSVADNRPKQTFIPRLGSKQKRTYSIGDKNKEIKKQGTKFIPK